jgi:hypothetical protein
VDDFTSVGRWWLPGAEQSSCAGKLVLDPTEFVLSTEAPLGELPTAVPGQSYDAIWEARRHPIVYGELNSGIAVTLVDAGGLATMVPIAEGTEFWRPHAAFVGAHLREPGDAVFTDASIVLSHLYAFAGSPTVGIKLEYDKGRKNTTYAMLEAQRRVLGTADVPGARIQLIVTPSASLRAGRGELAIDARFEVTLHAAATWNEIWTAHVLPLRDLLAILLDCAVDVSSLTLSTPDGTRGRLLLRLAGLPIPSDPVVSTHDFLVNVGSLPGGFSQALPAWRCVREESSRAVAELMDVINSRHMYADDRLVSYVRAVGPMSDELVKQAASGEADAEYARWITEVSNALPDHLRDGVIGRLSPLGPNERHRLIALIESLDHVGAWLTARDVSGFAQRVIATRNGIAHPSRNAPKDMLAGRQLVEHMRQLGWILRSVLLTRTGMSLGELGDLLANTSAAVWADASS